MPRTAEEKKKIQKLWRERNKDYFLNWQRNNRKKCREYTAKWYKKNKKYSHACSVQWHKDRPWIKAFNSALMRCTNPKIHNYKNYGGRGIRMLLTRISIKELWDRDNASSLNRPTLDRKNNNGNYTFRNCRFIEMSENVAKSNRERKRAQ